MGTRPPIVVFGVGGHAASVVDVLESAGRYNIIGLLDDFTRQSAAHGYPVLGKIQEIVSISAQHKNLHGIVAIGDNHTRMMIVEQVEKSFHDIPDSVGGLTASHSFQWAVAIHPFGYVSNTATINAGTVVCPGVVIGRDAKIGEHAILNSNSVVEHNCFVDTFAHIAPSVAMGGNCIIGKRAFLGLSACVIHGTKIGDDVVIGADSFVRTNCEPNSVYYGSPALFIRNRSQSERFL